jgi:hypothetical protein
MDKEEARNISQLFRDYDGEVQINPFAKVHWGKINHHALNGSLYVDNDKNYGIIGNTSKTNRSVRDFSNGVVGNIKKGDICINRFFYKEGYHDHVKNYISEMRKSPFGERDVWFTHVNMEHKPDKDIAESFNASWISSRIDAVAAEVRGIYYSGEQKQTGLKQYEDIPCCKLDYPYINGLDNFVSELDDFVGEDWGIAGHQKAYGGKEKTWTGIEIIPLIVTYGTKKSKQGLRGELNEDYVKRFPIIENILSPVTTFDDCLWLAITKVSPKKGVVTRHSDKGIDKMNAGIQIGKTARMHYCLQANPQSYFELQDLQGGTNTYHMKQGEYWYMDKRKPHAVFNKGDTFRYHMIFDMKITQNVLDNLVI